MTLFWNDFERVSGAESAARRATSAAARAQEEARWVEQRLDKLALICRALWELLRERTDLSEEDLMVKVKEIDLRDGEADGKVGRKIKTCPKCGRVMSPAHARCLYCGASELKTSAFDEM